MAISPLSFFWLDDPHDLQGMPTPNRNLGRIRATHSLHSDLTRFCVSRAYEGRLIGAGADAHGRASKKAFPLPRLRGSSSAAPRVMGLTLGTQWREGRALGLPPMSLWLRK
jgi:hypothetical protein